ncbi:MAG: rRNA pseudouridine synthase [Clostridiales bacterium]|nr:rRNA pseudouridine synthase [Clostridiales bacterium]
MERLQKYMASCGVASRRKCEEIIAEGRVKVNGVTVREAGLKIQPSKDKVTVDGREIIPANKPVYIMLNKPVGYVSTVRDQFKRPTVLDLLRGVKGRIYPVGRLDYDSEGLLLLTNDGNLAYGLTHPRHRVDKTYIVVVQGRPSRKEIDRIRKGVEIDGRMTSPADIRVESIQGNKTAFRVVIHEGRNRQVRRMFGAVGYAVVSLKRTSIGKLQLGTLAPGRWRFLEDREVKDLYKEIEDKL